ncbi:MAG: hypothetical protein SCH70_09660 [Candidatus Methanoperedens sp.]|nr:hypothetical protein [Candidatus Methanoperedens sp.]
MELIISNPIIEIVLIGSGFVMAFVTARYTYYFRKFKSVITESRLLLEVIEDILSDDKITPDELKTRLFPALARLRKLYGQL